MSVVKIANLAEVEIMARTIWGEARGEPWLGQVAVGHVICNRVLADINKDNKPDWWGEGIAGVCLKPYQFSCWNPDDPNLAKLDAVKLDNITFRRAWAAAMLALGDPTNDPTAGATHYHDKRMKQPPKWAWGLMPTIEIGKHRFYVLG